MIRKLVALALFTAFAAPALAEVGTVGISQIDSVANIYGRANAPVVRVTGTLVSGDSEVNVAGRQIAPSSKGTTVMTTARSVDQGYGRS
jgi:hypothetical protein